MNGQGQFPDDARAFRRGRLCGRSFAPRLSGSPRLWFHAASVGEAGGAAATVFAVRQHLPEAALTLTVATKAGFRVARARFSGVAQVLPFPVDLPWALGRVLDHVAPDLFVAFETEFWPMLYRALRRRGAPSVLLNGRVSEGSFRGYRAASRLLPRLFPPIFSGFRFCAMHAGGDARRIVALGAPPGRVAVLGSAKYDGLAVRRDPGAPAHLRALLAIAGGAPVLVAGSLRKRECADLPWVFSELLRFEPRLLGIFAPRHLERAPEITRRFSALGIPSQLLSDIEAGAPRTAPAVVVDRMGLLFDLYALGDLVFCGGTLAPVGGHNIMEPAAWGKAVFYGPRTEKVEAEREALEAAGAGFCARDAEALLVSWREWLSRLPDLAVRGEGASRALLSLSGVSERHLQIILAALSGRPIILGDMAGGETSGTS